MARCTICNAKIGILDFGDTLCKECYAKKIEASKSETPSDRAERDAQINAIMLTTETAPSLNITNRISCACSPHSKA